MIIDISDKKIEEIISQMRKDKIIKELTRQKVLLLWILI